MKITLRKANALQNTIQDHIKTIDVSTSVSLNEFQTPAVELSVARSTLVANDIQRAKLTKAMYGIRAQVGRANVESGVSDMLAEAAYIDKRLGHLKGLTESKVVEAEVVLNGKLEKLRNTDAKNRMYGYNDNVDSGVLTAEQIEGYKSEMRDLKKSKQTINDKVLELNVRTEIELDADAVALLQSAQLV
jgi:uncharacterized protein YdcH (DUF465 family)